MRLVTSHRHIDARSQRFYCVASLQEQEQEQDKNGGDSGRQKKTTICASWVATKIATNHCYKSPLLDLRKSLIYKGFSIMAER